MDKKPEVGSLERAGMAFRLYQDLSKETDRACALMAAEYCSAKLSDVLSAVFVDDKKVVEKILGDDQYAPLGTFSDLAYLMGLVSNTAHRELHLIRKIRNRFAHEYAPLTFEDPEIADWCRELYGHNTFERPKEPRANFLRNLMGVLAVLSCAVRDAQHLEPVADVKYRELLTPEEHGLVAEKVAELAKYLDEIQASGVPEEAMDEHRMDAGRQLRAFIGSLRKKPKLSSTSTEI
jgi:DNA-binding MltR family transcriptional regulator